MSSAALPLRGKRQTGDLSIDVLHPQPERDTKHIMGPRTTEDKLERVLEAITAQAQANSETMQVLAAALNKNGSKSISDRAREWIPTLITCVVLGVSVVRFDSTRETNAVKEAAVMQEKLTQVQKQLDEVRSNSARDAKLADERFRQLSIALEARGIRMPAQ